jgi:hypothetical protein
MKKFLPASLLAIYICALFAVAGAQSRSLDGLWQFAVDREGKLTINNLTSVKDWREIQVTARTNTRGACWTR